jgi:hypothetical protein
MSALAKELYIPICCVCGLVRESGEAGGGDGESWSDLGSYLDRHGLRGSEYKLTHTYCPICTSRYVPIGKAFTAEQPTSQRPRPTITGLILQTIRRQPNCNLDALVQACPQYTWNQVFLEVDRLSRTGEIELASAGPGVYTMTMPAKKKQEFPKSV